MKTTMKLMLMLLVVAGITKFSSCKKNPQIVGKWECTNDVMIEGEHQFTETSSIGQIWEFKGNGGLFIEERASAYSIEGNNLTITDTVTLPNEPQLFSQTAIIQTLTESQLSLSFEYQGNGDLIVSRNMDFKRL